MKTYICREDLLEEINDKIGYINFCSPYQNDNDLIVNGLERARNSIEDAMSEDVVKAMHEHWIVGLDGSYMYSECGRVFRYDIGYYCSFCGAKLDGEEVDG